VREGSTETGMGISAAARRVTAAPRVTARVGRTLAVLSLAAWLAACTADPTPPASTATPATVSPAPTGPAATPPTAAPPDAEPPPAHLIAAGDIALCDGRGDEATADLIDHLPGTVATLGDTAYPRGTRQDFARCYDPSWGRHRDRTRPAVGNHEYQSAGAGPYYAYFGRSAGDQTRGYYSYGLGAWHVVVLNSNCWAVGGCGRNSRQYRWLRADLADARARCTVAYWHHPLFTSGAHHGPLTELRPLVRLLYERGAEVILTGHNHHYERFAPQDAEGVRDPVRGLRAFVVGTGGAGFYDFGPAAPNSEVRHTGTHGVLALTLRPDDYAWRFVPVRGSRFTDKGSGTCH
jgi:acid phosphatase type 7